MSDETEAVADAVLAVPGVVGLAADPDADPSSPHVTVGTDETSTSVHVVIDADASVPATADGVRQAAHAVIGGRVDVTVEEVR